MNWIYFVFGITATYLYQNRPRPEPAKPPGLGDITVPTADSSREIPVIFGTVDIKSPNIVWYSDFEATPIIKKVSKK